MRFKLVFQQPARDKVIVVNDGSSDNTTEIVNRLCFKLIIKKSNQGVGNAIKTGILYGIENGYTHAITIDADGQHVSSYWKQFMEQLYIYKFVIGNRFQSIDLIPHQKISSNLLGSVLIQYFFGIKLSDASCGFRGFCLDSKILSIKACSYGFLHQHLLSIIQERIQIGIVNIPAIYDYSNFFATRISEISGFLEALCDYIPHEKPPNIISLLNSIKNKKDFSITIGKYSFFAFFVPSKKSYVFQTNVEQANEFYRCKNEFSQ